MNLTMRPSSGPELVTQESLLLQAAERIGRIREGRTAVHLHLSQLRPHHRTDAHLRVAVRMLDPLVQVYRAQMFLLENSDVVILCKDIRPTELDNLIYRLRGLFGKDPLTYADSGDGRDRFYDWYDLELQYDEFLEMCQRLEADAKRLQRERQAAVALPPLEPRGLDDVLERMARIDIAPLVRRQSAVALTERNRAEVLFQEFYVSVPDLQKAVSPEAMLTGNRWLFQHLSQTLDQRVLTAVIDNELRRLPPALSLNLNLATVFAAPFRRFEKAMADAGVGIVVEAQIIDVFADLGSFFYARDMLRERGHTVVLDGIGGMTLEFMDLGHYEADRIKLFWSPDFLDRVTGADVRRSFGAIGLERVILARCDSEAAIQWGLDAGIACFQGRYVDAMQSAMAMAGCPKAAQCTLSQCIARHGVVAGRLRGECHDLEVLDSFPALMAPRRRPRAEQDA